MYVINTAIELPNKAILAYKTSVKFNKNNLFQITILTNADRLFVLQGAYLCDIILLYTMKKGTLYRVSKYETMTKYVIVWKYECYSCTRTLCIIFTKSQSFIYVKMSYDQYM